MTEIFRINIGFTPETVGLIQLLKLRFGPQEFSRRLFEFFQSQERRLRRVALSFARLPFIDRNTGRLRSNIAARAEREHGLPTLKVGVLRGTSSRYSQIQEQGTIGRGGVFRTITAKRSRFLRVPLALNAQGRDRYGGRYPGETEVVMFRRPTNPNVVGAVFPERELARARKAHTLRVARAIYLLLRKVDLLPRAYIRRALLAFAPGFVADLRAFLARQWGGRR